MQTLNNYVPSSALFQVNLNIEGYNNSYKTDLKKNIRMVVIELKEFKYIFNTEFTILNNYSLRKTFEDYFHIYFF